MAKGKSGGVTGTINKPKKSGGSLSVEDALNIMRNGPGAPAPSAARTIVTAPSAPAGDGGWGAAPASGGGGGGGPAYDPAAAAASAAASAQAKANAEGKSSARKQNDATRAQAESQRKLIDSFGTQREIKLTNIQEALDRGTSLLMKNYGSALGSLRENQANNEASEADASFRNVTNAVRERGELISQAAAQGAGETDLIKTQLQALRNYSSNQSDVNRSFFDTLASVNSAITGLNSDTATSRQNMYNQSESDKESTWANYYNQTADTWTQIANIEASNTNTDSDSSEAYQKVYGNAADEAAAAARGGYRKALSGKEMSEWEGKGGLETRSLTSSNRAASVNLGGAAKKPEGATLRKW